MWQQGHSNDYFVMCLISRFILYEMVKVLLTVCTIQKLSQNKIIHFIIVHTKVV